MRLKLMRLGKSFCKGPLNDHGLLDGPWPIGDIKDIDNSIGHSLMAKYPGLFKVVKAEDKIFDKVGKKPKNKVYEDKIAKPQGVK